MKVDTSLMGGKMLCSWPPQSHSKAPKVCHICDQLYLLGPCHLHGEWGIEPPGPHVQRCAMKLATEVASCLAFVIYAWNADLFIITEEQSIQVDIWGMREQHPEEARSWLKVGQLGPNPSFLWFKRWWWCTRFVHTYATFFLWKHKLKCKWEHDNQYVDHMKLFEPLHLSSRWIWVILWDQMIKSHCLGLNHIFAVQILVKIHQKQTTMCWNSFCSMSWGIKTRIISNNYGMQHDMIWSKT